MAGVIVAALIVGIIGTLCCKKQINKRISWIKNKEQIFSYPDGERMQPDGGSRRESKDYIGMGLGFYGDMRRPSQDSQAESIRSNNLDTKYLSKPGTYVGGRRGSEDMRRKRMARIAKERRTAAEAAPASEGEICVSN